MRLRICVDSQKKHVRPELQATSHLEYNYAVQGLGDELIAWVSTYACETVSSFNEDPKRGIKIATYRYLTVQSIGWISWSMIK